MPRFRFVLLAFTLAATAVAAQQSGRGGASAQKPTAAAPTRPQPAASSCDALAAHPQDPQKPKQVKGVPDAAILPAAIDLCAAAVQSQPQSSRLKFQLGRALWAAKRYDEALEAFIQAEQGDYSPAAYYIARAYEEGLIEGEKPDLTAAHDLYMVAASAGFSPAVESYQGIEWDYDIDFTKFQIGNFMAMLHDNNFSWLTQMQKDEPKAQYDRAFMFYIIGIHNFVSLSVNEYQPSCQGLSDDATHETLRKYVAETINRPFVASGNAWQDVGSLFARASEDERANLAQQYGSDDADLLAELYDGCQAAPFRQMYTHLATFVRSGPDNPTVAASAIARREAENRKLAAASTEEKRQMLFKWFGQYAFNQEQRSGFVGIIDVDKPFKHVLLPAGQSLDCWILKTRNAGQVYTYPGEDPHTLGVDISARYKQVWVTKKEVRAIEAVAASVPPEQRNAAIASGGAGGGRVLILPWGTLDLARVK